MQAGVDVAMLACLGTINLHADYALAQHWTVGAEGRYNPFTFNGREDNQFQMRQRSIAAVGRWWPWHVYSGWWVAAKARVQEYNMGGIISQETEEGMRYGGGLSAGYAHMISDHFNLEMGLGFWAGMKEYTVYACPTCGQKLSEGVKSFILPGDLMISLSYVF